MPVDRPGRQAQLARAARPIRRSGRRWRGIRRARAADAARTWTRDLIVTDRVRLAGLDFDLLTEAELIALVTQAIGRGSGGTIVTPNVDICRRAHRDPSVQHLVRDASIVVPDGMPVLWAARLAAPPPRHPITAPAPSFPFSQSPPPNSCP